MELKGTDLGIEARRSLCKVGSGVMVGCSVADLSELVADLFELVADLSELVADLFELVAEMKQQLGNLN
ncbi:hypothetical protein CEXT_88351 [Caerostris extrusa]|uniref:Uncharacterized protein n=1 Tax=Caerostris extrusa TaxID=172846 RepID=A0AAV4MDV5_CAEEX|nr:hypothetical protein CEXT_88351 [Caerostris extrusa]